jgi:hypothetical protein
MKRTAIRQASSARRSSRPDCGGDHRQRAFAVAAEHRLQQVRLLGLGRQAGARTAALHVDDDHRQFEHHASPMASPLSAMPGPLEVVTPSRRRRPRRSPSIAAISSSAWNVRTPKFLYRLSSCRMSLAGVIG